MPGRGSCWRCPRRRRGPVRGSAGGRPVGGVQQAAVEVVLQDVAAHLTRPGDELRAALTAQTYAGGELVGGRDQHGPRAARPEALDIESVLVDGDADGPQSRRGDELALARMARVLDRQRGVPPIEQDPADQGQALGEARGDHQVLGPVAHPAHAAEMAGQDVPGVEDSGQRSVAELLVTRLVDHGGGAAEPLRAREVDGVGRAGAQVPQGVGARFLGGGREGGGGCLSAGVLGDGGARTASARQIALGRELVVRLDHDAAGNPDVDGELTGRGNAGSRL